MAYCTEEIFVHLLELPFCSEFIFVHIVHSSCSCTSILSSNDCFLIKKVLCFEVHQVFQKMCERKFGSELIWFIERGNEIE